MWETERKEIADIWIEERQADAHRSCCLFLVEKRVQQALNEAHEVSGRGVSRAKDWILPDGSIF